MPKRLTEDEKSANKAALKLKRAAHTARCKERSAREHELTTARVLPLSAVMDQKGLAFDEALKERNAYDDRCRAAVEALRAQQRKERVPYEENVARLAGERTAAVNARNHEVQRVQQQLDAEFPDLTGPARYHVSGWTPPKETPA